MVDLDFETDQSLAELQVDGWSPDGPTLDDQDGSDDLRAIGGVLTLTDDDGSTPNRWAHTARYGFSPLESGNLQVSAGTGGTYLGNPSHSISIQSGGSDIARIVLRNDIDGRLETGGIVQSFGDESWRDEFREFVVQWNVDADGTGGEVSLSFQGSDGSFTQVLNQPFLADGVPDGLKISAGWSSPVDAQLRIDSIRISPGPVCPVIAPSVRYDIATGSSAGDLVNGRINLTAPALASTPDFEIVGGSGAALFQVNAVEDSGGRAFGELQVAPGVSLDEEGSYTLDLQLRDGALTSGVETITVEVVAETAASKVFDALLSRVRYRVGDVSDTTVADWMSKLLPDGTFSDLALDAWTEAAARLGSLAEAYAFSGTYAGDATLRDKIFDGVVRWSAEVEGDGGSFVNPAWEWPRQIAAVGYFLFDDLQSQMRSGDAAVSARAWEVNDAIIAGSESAVTHLRDSEEHFWGGNLAYRLGAIQTRAAVMNDYNRPLTQATGFQRGFESTASFADIRSLMIKSFQPSSGPASVGLTQDGGFSQHVGGGAQLYTFGYGRDWANHLLTASARLADTPWELGQSEYDQLADYYLDGMQWQIYQGQGDYLAQGRASSRARGGANSNADTVFVGLVSDLIDTAGPSHLSRYDELVAARDAWAGPDGNPLVGNQALWNHDAMIHRSGDYYVSTKLNSVRSAGNETGNQNNIPHYLMGDGTTLIQLTGDEYLNARVGWDWHQLPGTTAESRTDTLPQRNWNHDNHGLNEFAGVVSDGNVGIAAFVNDRYDVADPQFVYHTVNANKGTFYFEDEFVALGSSVRRVGPGQNRAIRTTLNQTELRGDVTFDTGGGIQTVSPSTFGVQALNLTSTGWFHHDDVGYVVIPKAGQTTTTLLDLRQVTGDWHDVDHANAAGDMQTVSLFHLAIDHGISPTAGDYSYLVVPNVSAAEMPAYVAGMEIEILNNGPAVQAVRHASDGVIQVAFYEAGTVTLPDGGALTAPQPLLVLLRDVGGELEVTVADPLHSQTLDEATLTFDRQLSGPGADWDPEAGMTNVTLALSNEVTLAGRSVSQRFQQSDYGDAPAPYPTLEIDAGARHIAQGPRLGSLRDVESNGQPSVGAGADGGDEEGVTFGVIHVGATLAAVNVAFTGASEAKVDGWIDFNRDGDWSDPGEQILDAASVNNALQTLNYSLPAGITSGDTFARFRISSEGGLLPTGPAADGEVEDYPVRIDSPAPQVEAIVINGGDAQRSSLDSVTLRFDRIVEIDSVAGDPFRFINTDTMDVVDDVATTSEVDGKTVVDFVFAEGDTVTSFGSLMDGNYQLTIDAARVTFAGTELDGNGDDEGGHDLTFGDESADKFYRKYGDRNGNGSVELFDFVAFRSTYLKSAGDASYLAEFDSNGDESVNVFDFVKFRTNYGS